MNYVLAVVAFLLLVGFMAVLRGRLAERFARPLAHVDHLVSFPWSITLTIDRDEVPLIHHSGVYDAVALQRNAYALELRLMNTTDPKTLDPYSFFVPLEQTVLRDLARVLSNEAARLDSDGSPHWK